LLCCTRFIFMFIVLFAVLSPSVYFYFLSSRHEDCPWNDIVCVSSEDIKRWLNQSMNSVLHRSFLPYDWLPSLNMTHARLCYFFLCIYFPLSVSVRMYSWSIITGQNKIDVWLWLVIDRNTATWVMYSNAFLG